MGVVVSSAAFSPEAHAPGLQLVREPSQAVKTKHNHHVTTPYSRPYITPINTQSLDNLPPTLLVANGFDPLHDVGHRYARKLAKAGNSITYVHHDDLTHGFIKFTEHWARRLKATEGLADLVGERLRPSSFPNRGGELPSPLRRS